MNGPDPNLIRMAAALAEWRRKALRVRTDLEADLHTGLELQQYCARLCATLYLAKGQPLFVWQIKRKANIEANTLRVALRKLRKKLGRHAFKQSDNTVKLTPDGLTAVAQLLVVVHDQRVAAGEMMAA